MKEGGASPSVDDRSNTGKAKTDEELEAERKEARRRDEENSYRDVSIPSNSSAIVES